MNLHLLWCFLLVDFVTICHWHAGQWLLHSCPVGFINNCCQVTLGFSFIGSVSGRVLLFKIFIYVHWVQVGYRPYDPWQYKSLSDFIVWKTTAWTFCKIYPCNICPMGGSLEQHLSEYRMTECLFAWRIIDLSMYLAIKRAEPNLRGRKGGCGRNSFLFLFFPQTTYLMHEEMCSHTKTTLSFPSPDFLIQESAILC